jgi:hypothetical protein
MKKTACVGVVAGIILSLSMTLMGEENPAVQLAGFRIVGPGYGLNGTELQAFNQRSGTTLALIVQAPENKKIVEVDDSKCSLTEFTDDRGVNLLDGIDWDSFPEISEDSRLALVDVKSKNRPSQDASRFLAKGTINMRVATSESTEKINNLKLEVGTKVNAGEEIVQVMKVEGGNDGLTLVLQLDRKFADNMKDIHFYTAEGNPIEVWGRGSFTFGNASQLEYNLDTKSTPATLTVEIDIWQELEILNLPFEIESGVGF